MKGSFSLVFVVFPNPIWQQVYDDSILFYLDGFEGSYLLIIKLYRWNNKKCRVLINLTYGFKKNFNQLYFILFRFSGPDLFIFLQNIEVQTIIVW